MQLTYQHTFHVRDFDGTAMKVDDLNLFSLATAVELVPTLRWTKISQDESEPKNPHPKSWYDRMFFGIFRWHTLRYASIAMENAPCEDEFPIKNGDIPVLVCQRVRCLVILSWVCHSNYLPKLCTNSPSYAMTSSVAVLPSCGTTTPSLLGIRSFFFATKLCCWKRADLTYCKNLGAALATQWF